MDCISVGCTGGLRDGQRVLQQWDNVPCSDQCGEGVKVRPTSCVIREAESKSTLCRAKGTPCGLFNHIKNDNCVVQLFEGHVHGYGALSMDANYSAYHASRKFTTNEKGDLNNPTS